MYYWNYYYMHHWYIIILLVYGIFLDLHKMYDDTVKRGNAAAISIRGGGRGA